MVFSRGAARRCIARARSSLFSHPLRSPSTITDCSIVHIAAATHCNARVESLRSLKRGTSVQREAGTEKGLLVGGKTPGCNRPLHYLFPPGWAKGKESRRDEARWTHLPRGGDEFDYWRTTPVQRAPPSRKRGATRAQTRGSYATKFRGGPGFGVDEVKDDGKNLFAFIVDQE